LGTLDSWILIIVVGSKGFERHINLLEILLARRDLLSLLVATGPFEIESEHDQDDRHHGKEFDHGETSGAQVDWTPDAGETTSVWRNETHSDCRV
jgi:hypothetical protein